MPRFILKVGYTQYLLPNEKGLTTVLNVLDRAQVCHFTTYNANGPELKILEDQHVSCEIELVPKNTRVIGLPKHPRLPRNAGPDANGLHFMRPEE